MTKDMRFDRVIDIGCGTGALIEELSAVEFSQEYYGVDLVEEAIGLVRELGIPNLRETAVTDAASLHYPDKFFDLAILSHILEHVPQPVIVLKEAMRVAKYVYVEIPIEDTLMLNCLWTLRAIVTRRPRVENEHGHIVFFSKKTIHRLCSNLGCPIIDTRQYLIEKYGLLFGKRGWRLAYAYLTHLASKLLVQRGRSL